MTSNTPARTARRRALPVLLVAVALVVLAILGALASRSVTASVASVATSLSSTADLPDSDHSPVDPDGQRGGSDGAVLVGDDVPEVTNLDPDLLAALRLAATDATTDGVEIQVASGWRPPELQERLLREAVSTYGSEAEAARWVATAETSAHVSGDAVDVGPYDAILWLSEHGAAYGLCQIYVNESWHYELRPDAISQGCPPMYADPTQDPRMQP
ncbi:M15 family metallopeptidase [Sanguibacter sp. 25GB23B1]|uniref:M15 family metallopeptidase n=1 Tax=unclassified Sanguibacter TaxID=2645534 RepID=UPI0032B0180E